MRQLGLKSSVGFIKGGITKSKKRLWITSALLIILIAGLASYLFIHSRNNANKTIIMSTGNAVDDSITALKGSKNLDDQRSLISDYQQNQDYGQAESLALSVAQQTNSTQDYMTLLTLCATYNVPNKQSCINTAVSKLKPQVNSFSFYESYVVASMLDGTGNSKDAVVFYQQAYNTYDPSQVNSNTKTKDQIKQRIDQLNG